MPKQLSVLLATALVWGIACGDSSTAPAERVPTSLTLDATTVTLDDGATATVRATVVDQHGEPFQTLPSGTTIQWAVSDAAIVGLAVGGGGLEAQLTGLRPGAAQLQATMGTVQAQASVTVAQVAAELMYVSGNEQVGPVGGTLDEELVVRVVDRHGDGVPGRGVEFAVVAGGGSVSDATVQTDAQGHARSQWTLGSEPGQQRVEARAAGLDGSPVVITATGTELIPTGTVEGEVLAGDGQTPIQGATVTLRVNAASPDAFRAGQSGMGASDTAPRTTTDSQGRFTLEGVPEGDQVLDIRSGVFVATVSVTVVAGATVTAPAAVLAPEGLLGYVAGFFDSIQDILALYNAPAEEIDPADLASPAVTSRYSMIFINCGVDADFFLEDVPEIVENLKDYVAAGGLLYASDLEAPLIMAMFPDQILEIGDGDEQMVQASVVHTGLAAFLDGRTTVQIMYNLDGWSTLADIGGDARVLLQGDYSGFPTGQDDPLAIVIHSGEGQVVHTTFHNNAQATDDQFAVLRYFVFAAGRGDVSASFAGPAIRLGPSHAEVAGTPSAELAERHRLHRDRRRQR